MNTRFVTWTIVAMCLMGVAACGSDSPSIPTAPTLSTPPPASAAATTLAASGPYGQLRAHVRSWQRVRRVPKELRTRTYEARIGYYKSVGSADWFLAELSGAEVHSYQPVVIEVSGNSVSVDLSDNVIVDEPSPGAYLATAGYGVASTTDRAVNDFGFVHRLFQILRGDVRDRSYKQVLDRHGGAACRSDNSRWTLTRR